MRAANLRSRASCLWSMLGLSAAIAVAVTPAAAEELVLKNGQKIVGNIVGYENDMFRVETQYGFALVRKDTVETVKFPAKAETAKKSKNTAVPSEKEKERPARAAVEESSHAPPTSTSEAPKSAAASNSVNGLAPEPSKLTTASSTPRQPTSEPPKAVALTSRPTPPPPTPSRPLDQPLPAKLEEHVEGTTYVNDSFHFAMFKPPGWKVYEEVPKETGSAVMAIGTEDEQTLLFVDRQLWTGAPNLKSDSAEAKLRATYQEYQKVLESPLQLDGQPAIRRVFTGVIDGVEWHGMSVHVAHGNAVFGIIGLTSAETFQFQQALFNKIINSFHFVALTSDPPSAARP